MNKLTILGFMVSLLVTPIAFQSATAQTAVTSSATIAATCGLSTSPTSLDYGTVARNAQSSQQSLVLTNTGSVTTSTQINGDDWTGSGSIVHLDVGKTKYVLGSTATPDPSGVSYANKTALTTGLSGIALVSPSNSNSTYWQLEASGMQNLPFSGALAQTITFTFSCI